MLIKNFICLIFILISAVNFSAQTSSEKLQKTAERFAAAYNLKDYTAIDAELDAQMKTAVPPEKFQAFLDDLRGNYGKIVTFGTPLMISESAAKFPVEFERGKMSLQIALDKEGKIGGLRVAPPESAKPKNTSRNQTKLSLPFRGEWFVVWGGDTAAENYHQDAPNQRFAFDILKTDADGATHKGDGTKNEDYYAFGQEIIAPAAGTVVYAVDGVHDNKPGEMNRMFVPGNIVVIKHSDGEYSLFAHFKQNSIRVKSGDKITQGQTLGLCGNSGNSSEPHLHFQVQNTPFFEDEASMKVFFEQITVKNAGKTAIKTDYSPVKGEIISQN